MFVFVFVFIYLIRICWRSMSPEAERSQDSVGGTFFLVENLQKVFARTTVFGVRHLWFHLRR